MAAEGGTLLAYAAIGLGAAGLLAAVKGETILSVIDHAFDPSKYAATKPASLPSSSANDATTTGVSQAGNANTSSDLHTVAVDYAQAQIGKPYVFGGAGPNSFDCSGLTMRAMQAAGYSMPHHAASQYVQTKKYAIAKTTSPPAGTLVFYGLGGVVTHCGLSCGEGLMIEAPHTGEDVKYYSISTETVTLPLIGVTDPLSYVTGRRGGRGH